MTEKSATFRTLSDPVPYLVSALNLHGVLSVSFVRKNLRVSYEEAKDILEAVVNEYENVYWHKEKWIIIKGREKDLPKTFWR